MRLLTAHVPKKIAFSVIAILSVAVLMSTLFYSKQIMEGGGVPTKLQAPSQSDRALKTYRNEQYGFEFQYPKGWIVRDDLYGSTYYNKFTVVVAPSVREVQPDPFSANVVLPEFADRTFNGIEKTTSKITVDGVSGVKYEYKYEGLQEIAIVLPLGEYRAILGTGNKNLYENAFNQILATFKFFSVGKATDH